MPEQDVPAAAVGPGGGVSLQRLAMSAFLHAPVGIAVCTPRGDVLRHNALLEELVDQPDPLVGRDLFRLVPDDLVEAARAACSELASGAVRSIVHETRFRRGGGDLVEVRVTTSRVGEPGAAGTHLVMHVEDVGEHKARERDLRHRALHDPLTGLANRALFREEVTRALAAAARHGRSTALLFADLDGFKAVNDGHGHATGDAVLVEVGHRLSAAVRPEDTVARLGGDEFAVLCEDTDAEQAADIAARVAASPTESALPPVTTTLGWACSPGPDGTALDVDGLLAAADRAMYEAKRRAAGPERADARRAVER